ncbi:Pfam:DUF227 [Seminavis robusta]|uniref:Pfam:DUF227 n=1 Tax=Seminavis robusta TaxID=568900 RepID=A0A9N8HAX0_9STRA|nr:Pfam:DUF227 [Seminavis robusta]|eukprot:Sro337_g120540.1 Pfam:DUF227 (317) ;mRNA; r:17923-18873
MGNIYQVSWKSGSNNNNKKSIIVKYVHPRLSSGKLSIGDQRKLDSYIVESNFYEQFAPNLHSVEDVPLPPPPYHIERNLSDKTHPTIIIAMGELQQSPAASGGYNDENDNTHKDVMAWLAKFHAATWQSTTTELQPVGSYWHLDTRPNEWQDMPRHGWEGRLKKAARAIDERLKRDPLQCLVHGDTKDANILYCDNNELAFCDFQYVGRGPPSRDLSYYFCSSHVDDYEELVQFYFDSLLQHLTARGITTAALPTRQQLDDSLELAFCDFCRFMAGWGYWGYDLSKQVKVTLDKLDGGKMLKTEQDYQEAMERVFG